MNQRILFVRGPYCGTQGSNPTLRRIVSPPTRIQKRSKDGNHYYDISQVPLSHLSLVVSNCEKGLIPYCPVESYYRMGRQRKLLMTKLIKRGCPLLMTAPESSPIRSHWLVTHMAQDLGLTEEKVRNHLSGSIQHHVQVESKTMDQWNSWRPNQTLRSMRV